jgi:hypothetical protein
VIRPGHGIDRDPLRPRNCIDDFRAPTHAMRAISRGSVLPLMETYMKTTVIALLLLSLGLTGCIIAPGPGYSGHGYYGGGHGGYYGEHGYGDR